MQLNNSAVQGITTKETDDRSTNHVSGNPSTTLNFHFFLNTEPFDGTLQECQRKKSLTLLSIDHRVTLSILLAGNQLLTALGLLLLLDQVAEGAAAGEGNISDTGTLDAVLVTDVAALHGLRNPVETNAHGGKE